MISKNEAKAIVAGFLDHGNEDRAPGRELVVLDEHTEERDYGWLFNITTADFVRTPSRKDGVVVVGPVLSCERTAGRCTPLRPIMSDQPAGILTLGSATATLEGICRSVGLDARGATLLGPLGDNAVFSLPAHGLVARLALADTGERRLRREVIVARWLAEQDFPAVRIADGFGELVMHDGVVASFWEEVPEITPGSPAEIGELLRRLHQLAPPPGDVLSPLDPFAQQKEHIEHAAVPEQDREFLRHRLDELDERYQGLTFNWPSGVVHGDAHRKNVVRAGDGRVLLLDLERFGIGPREWDLIIPAVYNRVGWYSEAEYQAFAGAYGFDIRQWDGYTTMAGIRELRMTAWLAARTGREPRLISEARKRIASLRDDSVPRNWVPGE